MAIRKVLLGFNPKSIPAPYAKPKSLFLIANTACKVSLPVDDNLLPTLKPTCGPSTILALTEFDRPVLMESKTGIFK